MAKDRVIGGLIFIVCAVVLILYVVALFGYGYIFEPFLGGLGGVWTNVARVQFWLVAIPILIAVIAVLGIGAWIGWTMATTPAPKPIEEFELEEKEEK